MFKKTIRGYKKSEFKRIVMMWARAFVTSKVGGVRIIVFVILYLLYYIIPE